MSGARVVAHVITRLDVGGAQATAARTCALVDRRRVEPLLIAGRDEGSGGSVAASAEAAGVEVVHLGELVAPIRPWRDAAAVGRLRSLFDDRGVDIVHTHSSKAGVLGRLASRGRPTVHTVHGWSFHEGQRRSVAATYRTVERALAPRTDAWIVVTPTDQAIGLAAGIGAADRYHLIRSGIAVPELPGPAERQAVRRSLGWDDDTAGVLAIGRLVDQKDPLTMVDAFAVAAAEHPEARLAMVGGGTLHQEVAARIRAAGLDDRVDLLGVRADAASLLVGADAYLSSSRWEGLPRTVLEAIAVEVPVVATDVGGIRDVIVPDQTGLLVPAGDPQALGDALARTLADPAAAAALAARARTGIAEFDERTMVDRTMDLYDHVAAR